MHMHVVITFSSVGINRVCLLISLVSAGRENVIFPVSGQNQVLAYGTSPPLFRFPLYGFHQNHNAPSSQS